MLDNTLGSGNESFSLIEEERSKKLDVKVREENIPLFFGGFSISKHQNGFTANQIEYFKKLSRTYPRKFSAKQFLH